MSRPIWFVDIIKRSYKYRFKAANLTRKIPLVRKIVDDMLFKGDNIVYLPKDHTVTTNNNNHNGHKHANIEIQESVHVAPDGSALAHQELQVQEVIPEQENTMLPTALVEHFIRESKYHWVMNECLCRSSKGCKDYPINLGCIFLGKAVEGINPKLGRMVSMEEALEHLQRCREAGLFHMIGRNKLDTVWMGVKPGGRLMTICNCCPCCCLYNIIPNLDHQISDKIHKMPGVNVRVKDTCIGCGLCAREDVCFVNAIHIENNKAVISDQCRGCGHCVDICPNGAIELTVENEKGIEISIQELSKLVDLS